MAETALMIAQDTWDRGQLEIIKQQIAPNLSDGELALFAQVCSRTGLDPFTRQIYAIQRSGRMTIQTGIDGYRLLAARTGALAGIDEPLYDIEDPDEHPNKATVTVWRMVAGQRVPFTASARWREYAQDRSPMWGKMPYLMLGKCAEALALRKAFPAELSGLYTGEEMAQAENETPDYIEPAAPKTNPRDPWAEVRELALQLGLDDKQRAAVFKLHKKQLAPIVADLRARVQAQAAQEGEYTFTEGEPADLANLGTVTP